MRMPSKLQPLKMPLRILTHAKQISSKLFRHTAKREAGLDQDSFRHESGLYLNFARVGGFHMQGTSGRASIKLCRSQAIVELCFALNNPPEADRWKPPVRPKGEN